MSSSCTLQPGTIACIDTGPIPLFARWPMQPPRDVLVSVHGNHRQAAVHALRFASLAERHGLLLLAPSFGRARHPHFQRLEHDADELLIASIVGALGTLGVPSTRWLWFGHSAGAQFVHRLLYRHPHRVRRAVLSAAGWYTLPDPDVRWPHGLAGLDGSAPLEDALRVPLRVLVGDRDTRSGDALRRDSILDAQQGPHRLARAHHFVTSMHAQVERLGLPAVHSLRELPGAGHDFDRNMRRARLGQRTMRFLLADSECQAGLPNDDA